MLLMQHPSLENITSQRVYEIMIAVVVKQEGKHLDEKAELSELSFQIWF